MVSYRLNWSGWVKCHSKRKIIRLIRRRGNAVPWWPFSISAYVAYAITVVGKSCWLWTWIFQVRYVGLLYPLYVWNKYVDRVLISPQSRCAMYVSSHSMCLFLLTGGMQQVSRQSRWQITWVLCIVPCRDRPTDYISNFYAGVSGIFDQLVDSNIPNRNSCEFVCLKHWVLWGLLVTVFLRHYSWQDTRVDNSDRKCHGGRWATLLN